MLNLFEENCAGNACECVFLLKSKQIAAGIIWKLTLKEPRMMKVSLDFTTALSQEISREPLSNYNPEQVLHKAALCLTGGR